jgi:hypothetical protein
MKRLALSVAVGALAYFASVNSSQAAPGPGAALKLAPSAQSSAIVDQVYWRRHHRWHRWHRNHRWW